MSSATTEPGDTKSSDKNKSKEKKKSKKTSPKEQTLSPSRQGRSEREALSPSRQDRLERGALSPSRQDRLERGALSPSRQDRLEREALSPSRQARLDRGRGGGSAEDILSDGNNHIDDRRTRSYNHYDSKYGHNIGRPISPTESLSSIHDAQFYNDRIRCLESEKLSIMIEHNNLMKEFNRLMESHLEEVRNLKEANIHYEQEANDLRDLSVFLDDDRRKCRKLAKEWQRFGRHTVSVMRSEVMAYQEKVRSLETKQTELIKENGELRDLCVYLDSQRSGVNGVDGEISGALKYFICQECSTMKKNTGEGGSKTGIMKGSFKSDYNADQVHDLQNQILQLEKEKDSLHKLLMFGGKSRRDKKRVSFSVPTDEEYDSSSTISEADRLDFPPSFGGSNDNFTTIMEASMGAGILRNGNFPNAQAARLKFPNISPRNKDLTCIHNNNNHTNDNNNNTSMPLSEVEVNEIRGKLSRSTLGEATLSESEISMLKRMCNIATDKLRSDSNASNTSFDQSPLSPPPPVNGVPLYNTANGDDNQPGVEESREQGEDTTNDEIETPDTERAPLPSYDEMVQRIQPSNVTEQNDENNAKVEEATVDAGS